LSFEFPFVEIDGVPLEILEYPDSDYQAVVRMPSAKFRAGIMGGCKPAESHVEEREERKEKRTGGSLAAGCCGRVRLCLWPRMPLAAHSQPAAGAEQSSQPTARAGLLPTLLYDCCCYLFTS